MGYDYNDFVIDWKVKETHIPYYPSVSTPQFPSPTYPSPIYYNPNVTLPSAPVHYPVWCSNITGEAK